ncbi:MAG: glutaredoxin 3 [Gammaproteobacteria bacterium]|nr:glutaredoxin 3 [Gammaproteobacteria bacterium]
MSSVLIYTTRYCPYCFRAKDLLDSKGTVYQEIAVDNSRELRQEMMDLSGSNTVPQIFINNRSTGGCNELYALERAGKLDELLIASPET